MQRLWFGLCLLLAAGVPAVLSAETVTRRAFRTSDGVKLSFLEAGTRRKNAVDVAVALIPGWCMPAEIWRKQLDALGAQYYSVALDPRGQGRSDVPGKGYTADRRAADIDEFLRPLSRVVLVGWSLGAIRWLQYLHTFWPQKIAARGPGGRRARRALPPASNATAPRRSTTSCARLSRSRVPKGRSPRSCAAPSACRW